MARAARESRSFQRAFAQRPPSTPLGAPALLVRQFALRREHELSWLRWGEASRRQARGLLIPRRRRLAYPQRGRVKRHGDLSHVTV